MHMAMGTNRVVLGRKPRRGAAVEGGSEEEAMADMQEEEAVGEARDIVMTEIETATTATTETETEAGSLVTND